MDKNILTELNRAREIMGLGLLKENLGDGNGQNLGMMDTPTAKYEDLDLEEQSTDEEDIQPVGSGCAPKNLCDDPNNPGECIECEEESSEEEGEDDVILIDDLELN